MALLLHAPASAGDVLDRLTILAIKLSRVPAARRDNVERELTALAAAWSAAGLPAWEAEPERPALTEVNEALWGVEDELRAMEAEGRFDATFVARARSVYQLNDRRAALKRAVNVRLDSALVEEKVHPSYAGAPGSTA